MEVFRRPGSPYWYCYFYEDGKRKQKSTKCRDRKAAEAKAREFERRASDPTHRAAHETTLTAALAGLVDERKSQALAERKSKHTAKFYGSKSKHLTRIIGGDLPLAKLHARHVDDYIRQRREEGAKETTISKELVTLRAALKIAVRAGQWDGRVDAVIPAGFSPQYVPRTRNLTYDEAAALLSELKGDRAARVAFILATSANLGESDRARREDVAADCLTVHIRGTKRATRLRTVPVTLPVQQWLLALAAVFGEGEDGLLFRPWANIGRDLPAACARAGIPRATSNDLRRTCATWLHAAGAPPNLIAPVLGHADSRMVERVYGRLPLEDLRSRLATATGNAPPQPTASTVHQTGVAVPGKARKVRKTNSA